MAIKQIRNLDIDDALGRVERINKGVYFLSQALPVYPHEGGLEEIGTILQSLSLHAEEAIKEIEKTAGL